MTEVETTDEIGSSFQDFACSDELGASLRNFDELKDEQQNMKTPAIFKEYIWLVNTIHSAKRILFAEINEKWLRTEMSEGMPLSRTTFNRHKDAIEDIFGIYIDCDRKDGYRYYIGNGGTCWAVSTMAALPCSRSTAWKTSPLPMKPSR